MTLLPLGYPLVTGTLVESAVEDRRGISRRAPMPSTQQPMMYQLIPVLELVALRMAAAMSGAGPPAITEASW